MAVTAHSVLTSGVSVGGRPTVAIVTLGCKLNQADSDRMTEAFEARGFVAVGENQPADAVVVNTCTVTHVADRKSRQMLRRARRLNRHAVVAAVGCYPAVAEDEVRAMPEVDLVVRTRDKMSVVEQVALRLARPASTALDAPTLLPARALTRALVKIEEGCDARCTFCIIPRARGELTSLPADAIVADVRRLAVDHHEVILTGTNVGRYGYELERVRRLPDLLRRVLDETAVRRLRLSSVEPSDLTPALLALWRDEPRLARHVHLSLQAGSDPVLRAMRRRYNTAQFARAVDRVRAIVPEVAITTDIIGGFPGETDDDHAATLAFARRMGFSRIHVFPYSPRRGTAAATMSGQAPAAVRDRRCAELRALGAELATEYNRRWLGQTVEVLWEDKEARSARGPAGTGGPEGGERGRGSRQEVPMLYGAGATFPDISIPTALADTTLGLLSHRSPSPDLLAPWPPGTPDLQASWSGHTDTYLRVVAVGPPNVDLAGQVTLVLLTALDGDALVGEIVHGET